MSLPEVDPIGSIGYAQDAHKLIAAGFEFQPGEYGGLSIAGGAGTSGYTPRWTTP